MASRIGSEVEISLLDQFSPKARRLDPLTEVAINCLDSPQVEADEKTLEKMKYQVLWKKLKEQTEILPTTYLEYNFSNNRYENILSPVETAVDSSLHANYINLKETKRSFIASQAPFDRKKECFWQTVLDTEATIVDLTTEKDFLEGVTKYYPEGVQPVMTEEFDVNYQGKEGRLITYTLEYKREPKKSQIGAKTIQRYAFPDWPDKGVIDVKEFTSLIEDIEKISGRLWVHCKAGVGRTGTLITAMILKERIESKLITKENLEEKLIDLILELREMRGKHFVQTLGQFILLIDYAKTLL